MRSTQTGIEDVALLSASVPDTATLLRETLAPEYAEQSLIISMFPHTLRAPPGSVKLCCASRIKSTPATWGEVAKVEHINSTWASI